MGLGRSGLASARALMAAGAKVRAWDDDAARRAAAEAEGIPLADLGEADLSGTRAMVWSPGIPHSLPTPHPVAERARAAGVPLLCDIDLLAASCRTAFTVGVTGTNGKSTTTALIGHILGRAGQRVQVGGNLGVPALDLEPLSDFGTYVLELSSYQLDLIRDLTCDVAVLLNVSADHLERHGGMDGYVAAKRRILDGVLPPRTVCIGVDDETCRAIHGELVSQDTRRLIPFSAERPIPGGVTTAKGVLVDAIDGRPDRVMDLTGVATLAGAHNWQNAAAAYAACRARGLPASVIAAAIQSFPGLPHRHEPVATVGAVHFVNDSKATNAEAAEKAILCHEDIYWIAGGQAKEGGIDRLEPHLDRIVHAYLIGDAAKAFAAFLDRHEVPYSLCGTLDKAVPMAFRHAVEDDEEEPVVLLSPACASWDQFDDFAHRGDVFKALVADLSRAHDRAGTGDQAAETEDDTDADTGTGTDTDTDTDTDREAPA
nr:UDP-N-acetylmuramoyl-L-alanine--D-glutamate ligase [Roseospira visakhapatnamensis]